MKKLYLLFLLTPFLIIGQQHSPNCTHDQVRGEILEKHNSNYFQPNLTQNKVSSTIPYSNSFENGLGDFTVIIAGEGTYNWEVQTGHFVHDDDAAAGGTNYLQHDDVDQGAQVNWALTPTFDLSETEVPQLTYWDHVHYPTYADCDNEATTGVGNGCQEVMYSTDYTDDVNSATWVVLYDETFDNYNASQSNPGNAWGDKTLDLPSESNVTIAFKYSGNYASDWLIDDIKVFDNSAVAADWDVTTMGTTATLSIFGFNNFVVGTDGHWHYSVDGGDTVMVFDTNDVVIEGLSVGDHTITAWLVDNNHNPLDPPVEETISFSINVISDYPWCDGFESGEFGYGVEGWTTSIFSGTTEWGTINQNGDGSVTPLSGSQMVGFASYNYDGDTASIISPSMDLTSVTDPQLIFNYTQVEWVGDQDQLRVFYRSSYDGDWVQIGEYTEQVTSWTEIILDLPNPSTDYYVGFQATSGWGYGVTLDDVCVQAALSTSENEILDMMIYPNPVDGDIVTIQSPIDGLKEVQIYTVTGKKVLDTTINENTLDVSSFNSGFYMMKVTINGQSKVSKLVIR
tara:strand:- start:473 stop:2176 length:1704 start_codon:yes stop_codon:yes gene_type:complete